MRDVLVAGGGLAGLVCAIRLADAGLDVLLLEKGEYPFHKVCGEYISNEVVPFLKSIDCYPQHLSPAIISQFRLSDRGGKEVRLPLDMGGFGLSRFCFDEYLYQQATKRGAECLQRSSIHRVERLKEGFRVHLKKGASHECRILIGAWGKRSTADSALERPFFEQRTDYIGVKYHIKADLPHDEVALHNFPGGYCGISKIESGLWNMCYLGSRERLRYWGKLKKMEEKDLGQNPQLRRILREAEFVLDKPEVINQINFRPKKAVENGVLMTGDAAGLITPLCGNGMAMAIHSAKLVTELIVEYWPLKEADRGALEQAYKNAWQEVFARRLWVGRQTQKMFGSYITSALAVSSLRAFPPLGRALMRQTHGQVF